MILASTYSSFFESHTLFFLAGIGLFLTYANAMLNISSTSKIKYNWLYFDPFLFGALLYVEHNGHLPKQQCLMLYAALLCFILVKYLILMSYMIRKLTVYLNTVSFLIM